MIYLGSDHRGFQAKTELIAMLADAGYNYHDLGAYEYDPDDDFNDSAIAVSKAVRENPNNFGILICGSAHGMVIQANRFKGVRAITATDEDLVKIGRIHNDANILCLSADNLSSTEIFNFIKIFIATPFDGSARYQKRIDRLDEREDYA